MELRTAIGNFYKAKDLITFLEDLGFLLHEVGKLPFSLRNYRSMAYFFRGYSSTRKGYLVVIVNKYPDESADLVIDSLNFELNFFKKVFTRWTILTEAEDGSLQDFILACIKTCIINKKNNENRR